MSFRRLRHGSRQLVGRVEDVVAGELGEVHSSSSDYLVVPVPFVQQLLLRLVQRQLRPYSGGIRGVADLRIIAMSHVLRVVFLADGDGSFLTVAGDVHAEDSRHVGRLKPIHRLLLEYVEQRLASTEEQDAVQVEHQDNEVNLVLVDVHTRIRLARAEGDDGKLHFRPAEQVLRALPKIVPALLELHDERSIFFVVDLLAGRHLDEDALVSVGVD